MHHATQGADPDTGARQQKPQVEDAPPRQALLVMEAQAVRTQIHLAPEVFGSAPQLAEHQGLEQPAEVAIHRLDVGRRGRRLVRRQFTPDVELATDEIEFGGQKQQIALGGHDFRRRAQRLVDDGESQRHQAGSGIARDRLDRTCLYPGVDP